MSVPLHKAEHQPVEVDIKTVDGMFIRQHLVPDAGTLLPQHAHVLDHTTLLAVGKIMFRNVTTGVMITYEAPAIIFVKAGDAHDFVTLTAGTLLYCLHNLHHGDAPAILREHQLDLTDL